MVLMCRSASTWMPSACKASNSQLSAMSSHAQAIFGCVTRYFWATTPILVSLSTFSMYSLLGNKV